MLGYCILSLYLQCQISHRMFSMSQSAVNAHILMGFFYAYTEQNHFRKVTKMIIHIKDIVEVATCCKIYGCLSHITLMLRHRD